MDCFKDMGSSDAILEAARSALEAMGWQVECGKSADEKIIKDGWELDAYHPGENAMLEVSRGRAIESNEIYRNICRALALNMDRLVLVVPEVYQHANGKARSEFKTRDIAERLKDKIPLDIEVVAY